MATAPKPIVGHGQVEDQAPAARRVLEIAAELRRFAVACAAVRTVCPAVRNKGFGGISRERVCLLNEQRLERDKNPSVPFIFKNSKVPTQYLSNLGPAELRDGERKAEFSVSFPSRALYHGNIPEKCTKVESFNARPRNRTVAIAPFRNACDLKYCAGEK